MDPLGPMGFVGVNVIVYVANCSKFVVFCESAYINILAGVVVVTVMEGDTICDISYCWLVDVLMRKLNMLEKEEEGRIAEGLITLET